MRITAALMLALALVVGLLVGFFQESRLGAQLAEVRLESSQYRAEVLAEKASAAERVRKVEGDFNAKANQAAGVARDRERADAQRLAALRSDRERMRAERDEALARFAEATTEAQAEYVATLDAVFGECSERYEAMAGAAAGHSVDAQELWDRWPEYSAEQVTGP